MLQTITLLISSKGYSPHVSEAQHGYTSLHEYVIMINFLPLSSSSLWLVKSASFLMKLTSSFSQAPVQHLKLKNPTWKVVISIGLFWFYFGSFLCNRVCFICLSFNCTLNQYQKHALILSKVLKRWENFLPRTLCSFVSNTYTYKNKAFC